VISGAGPSLARACRLAFASLALLAAAVARAEPYTGPLFDAHLHYNVEATEHYPVASAFELFRKNGVRAILANSRPNDGTRALFEARRADPSIGVEVVAFIRVYRDRADYGTWQDNREIHAMIVAEEKRGFYKGIGEFHVHGRAADTPVVKDIVDFSVAKGLILHAHSDDAAIEILFRHNPKARVIWAHTGFGLSLERVEEMLKKYPALWGELSYRSGIADASSLSPEWKALFSGTFVRVTTVLFFVALLYHAWIGMRDIFMDYVKPTGIRLFLQSAVVVALLLYLIWVAQILWSH